jgi:signal transduction histidine kinase
VLLDRYLDRLRDADQTRIDWLLAIGLLLTGLAGLFWTPVAEGGRKPDAVAVALTVLMNLPLVLRRRHPTAVLGVVGWATILYAITGPFTVLGVGVLVALYSVSAYGNPRDSRNGLIYTLLGITISFIAELFNEPSLVLPVWIGALITALLAFGAAWMLGDLIRVRSEHVRTLEERNAELEEERGENARLAVEAERVRIARELHDVVAHNVSVMVVQAGAARRTLEAGSADAAAAGVPDADAVTAAREGLAAVETTGRDTMAEMRRMVGALRPIDDEAYEPTPSLAALDGLLERVRAAGLEVDVVIDGAPAPLPQGVDLSAYRIVQEALTNTLRHAHAASARVRLCYAPDALTVEVTDDGRGAAAALLEPAHHGYGIVGMRERVAMIGGEMIAGPRAGGGFEVRARLPLGVPA